jgi:hypothetical protein
VCCHGDKIVDTREFHCIFQRNSFPSKEHFVRGGVTLLVNELTFFEMHNLSEKELLLQCWHWSPIESRATSFWDIIYLREPSIQSTCSKKFVCRLFKVYLQIICLVDLLKIRLQKVLWRKYSLARTPSWCSPWTSFFLEFLACWVYLACPKVLYRICFRNGEGSKCYCYVE